LHKITTIASIGSSTRSEGAHLSDAQVDELLSHIDRKSFESRDKQVVVGYADALELIFDSVDDIAITENHIKLVFAISFSLVGISSYFRFYGWHVDPKGKE